MCASDPSAATHALMPHIGQNRHTHIAAMRTLSFRVEDVTRSTGMGACQGGPALGRGLRPGSTRKAAVKGAHVGRTREPAAAPSAMVCPAGLAYAPRPLPRHRRPCRSVAPGSNRWGTLRLTATGRRTGKERSVIPGYIEDGPNLVTLAMNGRAGGEPGWWLSLQAHPGARAGLAGRRRRRGGWRGRR
jgi:F420H(2)-dependent quinone reductase